MKLYTRSMRRGNVSIQVALSLTLLIGVAAIVVDLGLGRYYRQQLSHAAEAGAHAGAAQLDGSIDGMAAAREMAAAVAAENAAAGAPVDLDLNEGNDETGDIVLGYWDDGFVPSTNALEVTTVKVIARRTGLATFFASVAFDQATMTASDYAIAQAGGPSGVDCPIPLALADCELAAMQAGGCNQEIVLNSARVDNGAWGQLGTSQPNANYVRDAVRDGVCVDGGEVGEQLTLNNGTIANGLSQVEYAINNSTETWNAAEWGDLPDQLPDSGVTAYGNVYTGQVMVFDDPGNCVNTGFTGTHPIVGYATAVLYDVVPTGGDKQLRLRIACDEGGGAGGGGYFGTTVPPRFVR